MKTYDERVLDFVMLGLLHKCERTKDATDLAETTEVTFKKLISFLKDQKLDQQSKGWKLVSAKTFANLTKNIGKKSFPSLNLIAAYWLTLYHPEEWPVGKHLNYFSSAQYRDDRDRCWDACCKYYDAAAAGPFAENTIEKLHVPRTTEAFYRKKYVDEINFSIGNEFILFIEGITGTGKTDVAYFFAKKSEKKGLYKKAIFPPVTTGYSFDDLITDLPLKNTKELLTTEGAKIDAVINFLKQSNTLLILDHFENAKLDSFLLFIDKSYRLHQKTHVIIIQNTKVKFRRLRTGDVILMQGYDLSELAALAIHEGLQIEQLYLEKLCFKTGGIPLLIELFFSMMKSSYANITEKINKLVRQDEFRMWIHNIFHGLTEDERKLVKLLSVFNTPVEEDVIQKLTASLGIADTDLLVSHLSEKFIVTCINFNDTNFVTILQPVSEYINASMNNQDARSMHELVAEFYCPSENLNKRDFSDTELKQILKAAAHFQKAGRFDKSEPCIRRPLKFYKRSGFYEQIKELTSYELVNNPDRDDFIDWEFIHAAFILGEIDAAYSKIVELIINYFTKSKSFDDKDNKDMIIVKTVKYIQLYCEILAQLGRPQWALSMLFDTLTFFDIRDYDWPLRTHAVSIMGLLYFKTGDTAKALEIGKDMLNDLDSKKRGKAIACIRLGIINKHFGEYAQARADFEQSYGYLKSENHIDNRALAWCCMHLAHCLICLGLESEALPYVKTCLETTAAIKSFDFDYIEIMPFFNRVSADSGLNSLLQEELTRVQNKSDKINAFSTRHKLQVDYDKISKLLLGVSPKEYNYRELMKPLDYTPKKLKSRLNRDAITRAKKNPDEMVERIFLRKPEIRSVFGSHFYNKLIAECIKVSTDKERLIEQYILPNLEFILSDKNKRDALKFHYARVLQVAGYKVDALRLLENTREINHRFEYHIIKGNCFRRENYDLSYAHYQEALQMAYTYEQKGRIRNNIAGLIFSYKRKELYDEAKQLCIEAISFWKGGRNEIYPKANIILMTVEETVGALVVAAVKPLIELYKLSPNQVSKVIEQVDDLIKRRLLYEGLKERIAIEKKSSLPD